MQKDGVPRIRTLDSHVRTESWAVRWKLQPLTNELSGKVVLKVETYVGKHNIFSSTIWSILGKMNAKDFLLSSEITPLTWSSIGCTPCSVENEQVERLSSMFHGHARTNRGIHGLGRARLNWSLSKPIPSIYSGPNPVHGSKRQAQAQPICKIYKHRTGPVF